MAYNGLSEFVVKTTLRAITRLDETSSSDSYMRIAENVLKFCDSKRISPNQAAVIFEAMQWTGPVPEYEPEHTDEGLTLQDVSDAVADLSEVVSEIIEPESGE